MSSENNAADPLEKKGILAMLNPRSWSIKWKTRLNFFLRAIVAISLLVVTINMLQRGLILRETGNKLMLLTDTKSKYVEDYFAHLSRQISVFSSDRQTLESFSQLSESFNNIESDNFLTSSITGLDRLNAALEGFYKTEILPLVGEDLSIGTILPPDNKQRILQYLYIAENPKEIGLKGTLIKANDESAYSYMHQLYHPEILKFARQNGISDILFVDYKTGYVIYSLKKNLDFATSLFEGPYKNSGLGMAFKRAIALSDQNQIAFTDASIYFPALNKPNMFISAPVFSGTQIQGAIVFSIDNSGLDKLLTYDQEGKESAESLKSIIIGKDFLYRCDDPEFISNRSRYLRKLKIHATHGNTARDAADFESTSMIQRVDSKAFAGLPNGKEGNTQYTTETGTKVLCSYSPLALGNLEWTLITQIDKSDAMGYLPGYTLILIGIMILITIILFYISSVTNDSITSRLSVIKNGVAALINGERISNIDANSDDEIGFIGDALTRLGNRISDSAEFVHELSKGNADAEFPVIGENDQFGLSLNEVKKSLIERREAEEKRQKEDEIRNWSTQGIAMFNDILRMDNNDLDKLAVNVIRSVVQYLSANQGGLFLMEEDDDRKYLNLIASYAFDRQKFLKKRIEIGEGLAGTCVLEKKSILTNHIPDNYLTITSGLGGAKPHSLMVVPLKKDDEVLGVLEIASFENFKQYEVEFVEKVAESIASAMITVKLHLQTKQYLERFQQQAEEMKAQDEELRQNIEELQATHEQMERIKQEDNERTQKLIKEMEDFRKLLISVINEVPEKIFLKDDQGRFIIANKLVAENYHKTVEEILGKSDFDFYPREEAAQYLKKEQDIIRSGKAQVYEEGDASKYDGLIVRTIKKPFYIEHMGVTGLFGVQFDITDIKRKEFEALQLSQELSSKQNEIEQASVELRKEKSLLDALLDSVPEHIFFKDRESKFIRFSRSMLKLFGLKHYDELLGKSDFDFFAEEHARPAFEDEQSIIATGRAIIDLEEKEVMEDGRVSWVNTTKMPLKDDKGNIIGTFGISKDISRIKNMEIEARTGADAIEKNRKLLIDILNKVPAKVFLKDENGVFVVVNTAVASIYNKTPEEIIGTSDYDNHPDEDVDSWRNQELEIIRTGEKTYLHKENQQGEYRYLSTTKTPFLLPTTGKTGLLGMQFDITTVKILEEEVQKLREEVRKFKR